MLDLKRVMAAAPRKPDGAPLKQLFTPWGEALLNGEGEGAVDPHNGEGKTATSQGASEPSIAADGAPLHPHPQFARDSFISLEGLWDYAIVPAANAAEAWRTAAAPIRWNGKIRVPFSQEAPLSGVSRQLLPNQLLWYHLNVAAPQMDEGQLLILHFEAVDYACRCLVNGREAGVHTGGYMPFSFDITSESVLASGRLEILLCVFDPSDTGVQLRGKQRLERGGIWYTAQSGIWQTPWLEVVPAVYLRQARILPSPTRQELAITVTTNAPSDQPLKVRLFADGQLVAETITAAEEQFPPLLRKEREHDHAFAATLPVPAPRLWDPDDPFLYQLEFSLGKDTVHSYCAFRTVEVRPDAEGTLRFFLNHRPLFIRGVLDQGYWSDGLLTAPSDEALSFDIQTMKAAGFNLLRKHIKVEPDRWYYLYDKLGMLVWQDMVSGGGPLSPWHSSYKPTLFSRSWAGRGDSAPRDWRHLSADSADYRAEWLASCVLMVRYLENHPSVAIWGLFNEGWGQFSAAAAVDIVRFIDPTRPIDATSGWYDQGAGDFFSIHNYFRPLDVLPDPAAPDAQRAFVLSEFGGISWPVVGHCVLDTEYGYGSATTQQEFAQALGDVLAQAEALEEKGLAGFVYTQLSDVEEETNGLLTYDRRVNKLEGE